MQQLRINTRIPLAARRRPNLDKAATPRTRYPWPVLGDRSTENQKERFPFFKGHVGFRVFWWQLVPRISATACSKKKRKPICTTNFFTTSLIRVYIPPPHPSLKELGPQGVISYDQFLRIRDTTSRGVCGLVWPPCSGEREGKEHCVKEGWREEGERLRERARWGSSECPLKKVLY
jgi:hypothetical protein